jgi:methyltransferase (TIGR00027 family)
MTDFQPSQTALTAAAARAAHLIVDDVPHIFTDTIAATLLGDRASELLSYHQGNATHPILSAARAQVTCRSRYAEDVLATAAATGVQQYVLIGAGLDTFGCRSALAARLRVFEVDHPRTQEWKRQALAGAGLATPPSVTFVPADLDRDSLADALAGAGLDFTSPVVVGWLGVTMYLSLANISRVLGCLATCAAGSQLVADYMLPEGLRDAAGDNYVQLIAAAAAEREEPWRTFLSPAEVSELLAAHGHFAVKQLRQRDLVPAALWQRTDSLRPIDLSMVVRATVTRRAGRT